MFAALGLLLSWAVAAAPCEPQVTVRGPGVPLEVVDDFRDVVVERARAVAARLDVSTCTPVTVTLVPAMERAPDLDPPWHLPSWAAGAAMPQARRIVIGITAGRQLQNRGRTLDHELAHVFLHEATGGAHVPRWFDEGVARVVAGEHGTDDLTVLARARLADALLPLATLSDGFPPGPAAAALAYAEAGRAVSLIVGQDCLPAVLANLRRGTPFETALQDAFGRASWQLDVDVERSIPRWRALAVVGLETDIAMGVCAVLVGFAGVRARRRLHERITAMDDVVPTSHAVVTRWTVRKQP